MKKQRILSALLALCLVFSLAPTALAVNADDFTDVGRDSWCYEYVDYVTSKGYFLGTSDTTFSPDRNMTRAMFVVVLSRFDGAKVDNSQSAFTDVEPGSWCAGAINWAAANKIVEGKGDGKFAPNDPITRAQMCAIMDRYLNYYMNEEEVTLPEDGAVSSMTDRQQVPSYAVSAVKQCQRYGLINGYSDGTFRPQALSTRAHVAAVVYRMANLVKNAEAVKKPSGGGEHRGHRKPTYTYTLVYNANEGTFTGGADELRVTSSNRLGYADFTASAVPTREGYTFQGWADSDTGPVRYEPGSTIRVTSATPKTVYAVWQKNAPKVHPNDLVGQAVDNSVTQVNDKYKKLKKAVIEAIRANNAAGNGGKGYLNAAQLKKVEDTIRAMVGVTTVTYGNESTGNRTVTAAASLKVNQNQVVDIIDKATTFASEFLSDSSTGITADDVNGFVNSVKAAVEQKTDIDLTDQTLDEIKTQVLDKVKGEGKALWANFYDANGYYYCGNVTITAGSGASAYTVTVKVDADNRTTSLVGVDKTTAVKKMGEAIAKDMFQQLKSQSTAANGYVDNTTMTGTVTVTFAPSDNKEYAEKTKSFPNVYEVSLNLTLNSNGLVKYKYKNSENYVLVNISPAIQKAWNDGLDKMALSQIGDTTMSQLEELIKSTLTEKIDDIYASVETVFTNNGLSLDSNTKSDILTAMTVTTNSDSKTPVRVWLDTNIGRLSASLETGTITGLNNNALIDAVWDVISLQLPKDNEKMEAWVDAMIASQMANVDILEVINNNKTIQGYGVSVTSIGDINTLMSMGIGEDKDKDYVFKRIIFEEAEKTIANKFSESATYSALYATLSENTKLYLTCKAVMAMGLNFSDYLKDSFKYNTRDQSGVLTIVDHDPISDNDALTALLTEITKKENFTGPINTRINSYLESMDVDEILEDGALTAEENEKIARRAELLNSLKFSTEAGVPGVDSRTFAGLADLLRGTTVAEIVDTHGDTYVAQYLSRIFTNLMNLLPDGAVSINIDGVVLTEADLAALADPATDTTLEAVHALADILEKFEARSINSFAPEAGLPATVTYNTRTFDFYLVIDVIDVE